MDWSNERYVRLFTRDTTTWKLFSWQARCLLSLLLRKVDRSGVVEVGDAGVEGLAAMVELPIEVVEAGAADLTKRHTLRQTDTAFVLLNYIEAQETKQSDPQRQRESRERRRQESLTVTAGHTPSQTVTPCHTPSHDVTPARLTRPAIGSATPPTEAVEPVKKPDRQKRAVPIPEDWTPNAAHVAYAAEHGIDLAYEVGNFRDTALKKDSRWVDWNAAFRNWLKSQWVRKLKGGPSSRLPRIVHPEEEQPSGFDLFAGSP